MISPHPIGSCQAVPYPYLIRCSPEPKVIGLQGHPALPGLVQKDRQPYATRPAFAQAAQKKILRHAAFEHCIHNQNVSPLQFRMRAKQNFAPRMAVVIHVANVFACVSGIQQWESRHVDRLGTESCPTAPGGP